METSDQLNLNNETKKRNSQSLQIQENKNPQPRNILQMNSTDRLQAQKSSETNQVPNANIPYQFQNPNQAQNSNTVYQVKNPNKDLKVPIQSQNAGTINGENGAQIVSYLALSQLQLIQLNIESLNIKILNFLNILGNYSKIKILCNKQCCGAPFRSIRSHKVIGINEQGEENLIMTDSITRRNAMHF